MENLFNYNWELCKLGKLAEFNPKSNLPEKFEYVDLESVVGTELVGHRLENRDSAPSRAQRLAKKNDVFYQTVRPYQKNNYLFDLPYDNYVFSTGYAQMRPSGNGYFLLTLVQEEKFVNRVLERSTGTSYPAISSNDLAKLSVRVPADIEEEQNIGKFFSNLDNLVTLHQRKLDQLKELKKAYLQLMFPTKEERVPKLRFADFEGEWELCKLNGILDIIKGTQKSKSELSTNQNNCTPYPVYNGGINPSGYTNIYNRENAITISEGGNSAGFVNFVQEKFFSGGHNYTIVNNVTDTLFLFFYLCSIQEEIMRLRVGTGLPNIQKPTLMNLEIQKTTDNEQKSIGLFLKNIDILISLTQNKLNQLKSLKKSYLQNMFI